MFQKEILLFQNYLVLFQFGQLSLLNHAKSFVILHLFVMIHFSMVKIDNSFHQFHLEVVFFLQILQEQIGKVNCYLIHV
jgi:hypothetical protein